jgi:molybdopterin/thiamine biosynthesis adenylyltransferase/rhodanese-related sulfurtransferase
MLKNDRYIRQIILPGFGIESQDKLRAARVLIVGMGGLGCPALQYLVAAGVGTIGIMDADKISTSNLHRQVLFNASETGQNKAAVAMFKMQQQNPDVLLKSYPLMLNKENAIEIINEYDLVIDATDNFPAKYLINDVCVLLNKPWVYGAVSGYQGQVTVFNLNNKSAVGMADNSIATENNSNEKLINGELAINYRNLFPVTPKPGEIATCEEAGVIGVLPGMIGNMQAAEAIKLITGIGTTLYGRLFNYDFLQSGSYEIVIAKSENAPVISRTFFDSFDYSNNCSLGEGDPEEQDIEEINVDAFLQLKENPNVFILDVREKHEYPAINFSDAQIPMSELQQAMAGLPEKEICIICHQGIRSVYAAQLIKLHRNLTVYSLKGGLTAYFKVLNR